MKSTGRNRSAGLPWNWIAVVDANFRVWIKGEEPTIRQIDVQHRRKLQIADVSSGRIAGKAYIVSQQHLGVAALAPLRWGITCADDWKGSPFAAGDVFGAGRGHETQTSAGSPTGVELPDQRRLDVRIPQPRNILARGIVGCKRISDHKGQIPPQGDAELLR